MGGSQNDGPVLGPLNTRRHIVLRTQKGTMILTTTHVGPGQTSLAVLAVRTLSLSVILGLEVQLLAGVQKLAHTPCKDIT